MATFFDLVALDETAVQLHLALDKARTSNDPDLKSYIESTAKVSRRLIHRVSCFLLGFSRSV